MSARPNPTANAASTDPRAARLAAARAKVMSTIGGAARPVYRRLGIQPEAFPPNALWSLTGRPAVRRARERDPPRRRVGDVPAPVGAVRRAAGCEAPPTPLVAEMRDLWAGNPYFDAGGTAADADREAGVRARRRHRDRHRELRRAHGRPAPRDRAATRGPSQRVRSGAARPARPRPASRRARHARPRRDALRRPLGGHAAAGAVATGAGVARTARPARCARPRNRRRGCDTTTATSRSWSNRRCRGGTPSSASGRPTWRSSSTALARAATWRRLASSTRRSRSARRCWRSRTRAASPSGSSSASDTTPAARRPGTRPRSRGPSRG